MSKKSENTVKLRYEDRADLAETFVDSVHRVSISGPVMTIEFTVTRMDPQDGDGSLTGRRVPACRLVMPAPAAADLANKLGQLLVAMKKAAGRNSEDVDVQLQ